MNKVKSLGILLAGSLALEGCCCLTIRKPDAVLFTCNSQGDYNRDGSIIYPYEYSGEKREFCDNENLMIVSHDAGNLEEHENNIIIYTPSGRKIENPREMDESGWHAVKFNPASSLSNFGGYGTYKTQWIVDEKIAEEDYFSIKKCSNPVRRVVPAQKKSNKKKKK